jgi:enolase-phosphatase E1
MDSAYKLYLLDIEGTVAPLSLVTEQLFPYARKHFANFLVKSRGDERVQADLALLATENRGETDTGVPCLPEVTDPAQVETPRFRLDAQVYFTWLMDRDRKSTALKSLQGKIWKAGFESGELKGTLFADVPNALFRWSAWSRIAIYSSGSVEAQQLLFRHSNYGDLTGHISGYFDTRTGPKKEGASYAAIAAAMGVEAAEAIFFSDVVAELDAAREAELATRLVVREGNAPVEDANGHQILASFDAI